jgi:ligand-binding sensor domain-containing protein/signal transduction histidine kinase
MPRGRLRSTAHAAASVLVLLAVATVAAAERLPIRIYSVADGLPHNVVNRIVRDSRGFLWFCTADGLSLFDGYRFSNFGVADGLPHPTVRDLFETRDGEYLVATSGGVSRFNPRSEPKFTTVPSRAADPRKSAATVFLQGQDGTVWVGTLGGLMRLDRSGSESRLVRVEMNGEGIAPTRDVTALLEDRHRTLWIGTDDGLYRWWRDGRLARYTTRDGLPSAFIHDLLEDRRGQLWVATRSGGFFTLTADAGDRRPVITRKYSRANGYVDWAFDLFERADGRLEVATNFGLYEFRADDTVRDSPPQMYTKRHGFSYHEIETIAEDRDGNLWLGSVNGAMKVARGGFVTFDERDNVHAVKALFESPEGELHAFGYILDHSSGQPGAYGRPSDIVYLQRIGRFDGQGFSWLMPDLPAVSWSDHEPLLLSRTGEWWIGTIRKGLYLFPAVRPFGALQTTRPVAVYDAPGGHRNPTVYALYEEADGDIWISIAESIPSGLARWERRTRTIRDMARTPGLPSLTSDLLARTFQEDRAGNVWIGFNSGTLARYASDRFTLFTANDGLPPGQINDLHLDAAGRLWIGSSGGLSRVDDPSALRPVFVRYTTADGLSSSVVTRITEDLQGRIYAGTARGIDRLAPASGRIRHFTTADGLVPGEIRAAFRDKSGALWFGTLQGLSRIVPEADPPSLPPPIWIRGLHVAGKARNVSVLGEAALALHDLPAGGNQLQIDFGAVSFAPGETLRYQYKLTGAGDDWSIPTDQQTLQLAGLAPGRYTFAVRALNADGVVSDAPAQVAFTILAPVWRRPWFIAIGAIAAGIMLYGAYRYRVSRLLELERIRTRIASDLHDDIGAALSRIAVLSEVARHEAGGGNPAVSTRLSVIAGAAREVLDSMNDIVWAINPRHDQLHGLAQRMRRFASDLFTARGVAFAFRAPDEERFVRVAADVRRHVFLIFKEAVNNIVRHAGATLTDLEMRVDGSRLSLTIVDNGRGFDVAAVHDGNGLANMRDRARMMGGRLDVTSSGEAGTIVRLTVLLNATVREHDRRLRRARPDDA